MFLDYLQAHWVSVMLVALGFGAVIFVAVAYGSQIRVFIHEVRVELKKASWPWDPKEKGVKKYKELIDSTVMVLIATLLMGGYIAFWDFILVNIVGALTRS
jgi:preprotein translocase subunit SecE